MTAVELEVFTKLAGKSVNMKQLQEILEMESRPAEVFSVALVSIGLLSKDKRENVLVFSFRYLAFISFM